MELLVPVAAFVASCLLIAILAWWSGAWRSLFSGVDDEHEPGKDPEVLLRSDNAEWIENHEFWETSEIEEIAL
ncbi:MAG: hypothetical protein F4078_08560 [Acidimicrobiia bacterium]|nr:hypothetical protein [bacterium]MXZ29332.1 hypothetical protein [Acidimicrobiia bacterium]MYB23693.1 hypothetical protein [Acidimicrobiia bacterium]MYJ14335.1 hypothetical protein [Acidimicrobiia bacterium]